MPGADGDLVIVDMDKKVTLSNDSQITACGWTPYDGIEVQGYPVMTLIRGNVVMKDDMVLTEQGFGEFVPRLNA